MKNLLIIGAGGLGREIEYLLIDSPIKGHNLIGYLDDDMGALDNYPSEYKILDKISSFIFNESHSVILAISDNNFRKKLYDELKDKVEIINYIHPSSKLSTYFDFESPCLICREILFYPNIKLGSNILINNRCIIAHDVVIKNNVSIMNYVVLSGHVTVGENVYIGSNATIIPGITIGDNIKIGAGSVVVKDLKEPGTYVGNPAKLIKKYDL